MPFIMETSKITLDFVDMERAIVKKWTKMRIDKQKITFTIVEDQHSITMKAVIRFHKESIMRIFLLVFFSDIAESGNDLQIMTEF